MFCWKCGKELAENFKFCWACGTKMYTEDDINSYYASKEEAASKKAMPTQSTQYHFGVKLIRRKYSFKLCREEFAVINRKPSLPRFDDFVRDGAYAENTNEYTPEWCRRYREVCLENYDYNMEYFNSLSINEFNHAIDFYLGNHPFFIEITDLNPYDSVEGYYIMVLDEYKQVYIGKSDNIKRRIRQHWTKTKEFDRTLLPIYNTKSVFSIDFFRALDTTRIYVWKRKLTEGLERKLVSSFPNKFSCNRIGGDVTTLLEAMVTINSRTEQK